MNNFVNNQEINEDQQINELVYIGFWKRVLMALVELLVMGIPFVLLYRASIYLSTNFGNSIPFVFHWIVAYTFLIFMVVRFGGTPGKLIFKARIVDRHGKNLSAFKAILRFSFYLMNTIISILIFYNDLNAGSTIKELSKNTNSEGTYSDIQAFIGFIILIDAFVVILNRKRKRAIHDFLAGSYVVSKESLDKFLNNKNSES